MGHRKSESAVSRRREKFLTCKLNFFAQKRWKFKNSVFTIKIYEISAYSSKKKEMEDIKNKIFAKEIPIKIHKNSLAKIQKL